MSEEYLVEERAGIRALLEQDDYPEDPRREYDHLGQMFTKHPRYTLGEHTLGGEYASFEEAIRSEGFDPERDIWYPLYLLDHSGLWMRTGRYLEDPQGWDTSLVGFIVASRERIRAEYGLSRVSPRVREEVSRLLLAEVEEYGHYLSGDVYAVIIEDPNGPGDSCCGFYGLEYAEEEARRMLRDYQEYTYGIPLPLESVA